MQRHNAKLAASKCMVSIVLLAGCRTYVLEWRRCEETTASTEVCFHPQYLHQKTKHNTLEIARLATEWRERDFWQERCLNVERFLRTCTGPRPGSQGPIANPESGHNKAAMAVKQTRTHSGWGTCQTPQEARKSPLYLAQLGRVTFVQSRSTKDLL